MLQSCTQVTAQLISRLRYKLFLSHLQRLCRPAQTQRGRGGETGRRRSDRESVCSCTAVILSLLSFITSASLSQTTGFQTETNRNCRLMTVDLTETTSCQILSAGAGNKLMLMCSRLVLKVRSAAKFQTVKVLLKIFKHRRRSVGEQEKKQS